MSLPGAAVLNRLRHIGLPLRMRGMRIYVLPTRYGWIFFLMLSALLLGSVNHNNNLGFILTFLLGGVALVSVFHTLRNISGISLVAARAQPVFAGQDARFEVEVDPGTRGRYAVSFYFSPARRAAAADLPPGGRRKIAAWCPAVKRGILTPGLIRIATTFPLGLFQARSILTMSASCLVYPRPIPGPLITAHGHGEEEGDAGDAAGAGVDDFAGLESYRQGDPLHHISWKAYSRGQGLHTKKFEGAQGRTMFFDPDVLAGRNQEWRLSRICYMLLSAEAMRISYGLRMGRRIIGPGSGGDHKRRCLRELALAGRTRR